MTRLLLLLAVSLGAGAALDASAQEPDLPPVEVGIDANTSGNSATQLGALDVCREAEDGESFDVDIWVRDIPPAVGFTNGLIGFAYNLLYDPAVVQINEIDNELMIAAGGPVNPFEVIDADPATDGNQALPSTGGNLRVDYVDLAETIEGGEGVLSRITLEVIGPGETLLQLVSLPDDTDQPLVLPATSGYVYPIPFVQESVISVGAPCSTQPAPRPVERPYGETPPAATVTATASPAAPSASPAAAVLAGGPRALPRTGGAAGQTAGGLVPAAVAAAGMIVMGAAGYFASRKR